MSCRALLARFKLLKRHARRIRRVGTATTCCSVAGAIWLASAGASASANTPTSKPGRSLQTRVDELRKLWEARAATRVSDQIIVANVLIFLANLLSRGRWALWGVKDNTLVLAHRQWWRLLTCTFLHKDIIHLAVNMASVHNLSTYEGEFGRKRWLFLYIGSGIGGSLCSLLFTPVQSLGASGSICGLCAAAAVLVQDNKKGYRNAERVVDQICRSLAVVLAMGVVMPFIDNWAHVGGCVAGGLLAYLFGPRYRFSKARSGMFGNLLGQKYTIVDEPRVPLLAASPKQPALIFKRI